MAQPQPPANEDDNWVPFGGGKSYMDVAAPLQASAPSGYDPKPYVELVTELLAAEQARVDRMEARGLAVVTTSGTLATLLLGIAALVTRVQAARIDDTALTAAAIAAAAFVFAACLAIAANRPTRAWNVDPAKVDEEMPKRWGRGDPPDRPEQKVTATRMEIWKSLRGLSQSKAELVFAAMSVEAVAVLLLTVAVMIILL